MDTIICFPVSLLLNYPLLLEKWSLFFFVFFFGLSCNCVSVCDYKILLFIETVKDKKEFPLNEIYRWKDLSFITTKLKLKSCENKTSLVEINPKKKEQKKSL